MKYLSQSLAILFLFVFFGGCSDIKVLSPEERKDLYNDDFLKKISTIKSFYKQNLIDKALVEINELQKKELWDEEFALLKNLEGVILFEQQKYEEALKAFKHAIQSAKRDIELLSHAKLNYSSTLFELKHYSLVFSYLEQTDMHFLSNEEKKKYYRLKYHSALQLNKLTDGHVALARYLSEIKNIDELNESDYFLLLKRYYFQLTHRQQVNFLEEFDEKGPLSAAYVGYLGAEELYLKGEKEDSKNFNEWLKEKFYDLPKLVELINEFEYRVEAFSKIDNFTIGIILPLSGKKGIFGERAILGIDSALNSRSAIKNSQKIKLVIKDNQGSPIIGRKIVQNLIKKHSVSLIIGGLFSKEGEAEYLETKKFGVPYISLSNIYLSKGQKSHLLVEVPGSLESQLEKLLSPASLQKLGHNVAILYPDSNRGRSYAEAFWKYAKKHNENINSKTKINITGLQSYSRNITDFRGPVARLLNLKYKRERSEELDIWESIYSLKKSKSIRRLQVLSPILDFDWVYIPAIPKETIQIIPIFHYFDAFKLTYIGGPSWRSRLISNKAKKWGKLYFVENAENNLLPYKKLYEASYGHPPRLVEKLAYDALQVSNQILSEKDYVSRFELELGMRNMQKLEGITGEWTLNNNLWIKSMKVVEVTKI